MTLNAAPVAFDRCADRREDPDLLEELRADPRTLALVVWDGRVPLDAAGRVRLVPGHEIPADHVRAFLGQVPEGAVVLATVDEPAALAVAPRQSWFLLREVGAQLSDLDAELVVAGVSLARWLGDAPFCPACGARTLVQSAGWSRHCPSCGREHFPRTDPAVIVAVSDAQHERLLLGSNAAWPAGRFSCFAGFVEAGESAETAVVREVEEEAGVRVATLDYVGSQAWPYPRSLMLGYLATAAEADAARPDGVEIDEVRWFDRSQIAAALREEGDVLLPGPASIAYRLIRAWEQEGR